MVVDDGERNLLEAELLAMARDQEKTIADFTAPPGYAHLPLAIIDSVYSLRSRYVVAQNAVAAYCKDGIPEEDRGPASRTDVVEHTIGEMLRWTGGLHGEALANMFGGALSKAPGTTKLKAEACVEAAQGLHAAGVDVRADLHDVDQLGTAKGRWRAVRGLGPQSWSYFTMLAGIEDWKVDTWVKKFVVDAVGRDVNAAEGRQLLDAAIDNLQADHDTELSRRAIDHAIWRSKSGRPPR